MSLFRPLGSTIPDPVMVDVASFFDKSELTAGLFDDREDNNELLEFNLASPKVRALSLRHQLCQKDIDKLEVSCFENTIHLKYGNILTGDFYRRIEINDDAARKIGNCFKMCHSIQKMNWKNARISEAIMVEFLHATIGEIRIEDAEINASSDMFLRFLQHNPDSVTIKKTVLSNELITNENMQLLKEISVASSLKRDRQTNEYRRTNLTDDFLYPEAGAPPNSFDFAGFYTNFTVDGIMCFAEEGKCRNNFGTLGLAQLSDAVEYYREMTSEKNNVKLYSLNGQKTLVFQLFTFDERRYREYEDYDEKMWWYNVEFAVSLVENDSESAISQSVPEDLVSAKTLKAFDNYVNVFNGLPSLDVIETDKYDMSNVSIYYDSIYSKKEFKFEIKYKLTETDMLSTLVKTDIDRTEVLSLIEKFLRGCRSIADFHIMGFVLDDEFYEFLKPIVKDITVKDDWMIHVALNASNFCETLNSSFFKLSPRILSEHLITDEVVIMYIERDVEIQIEKMFKLKYEELHRVPLTDNVLHSVASKGDNLPIKFSTKTCLTEFTAKGIKAIIEAFSLETENTYKYHLGTIREENGREVEKMLEEFKDDNPGKWELIQRYKTERNGTRTCVVTLSRNTVVISERFQTEYATTSIEFEVLRMKDVVETKTRKRKRASSESHQE